MMNYELRCMLSGEERSRNILLILCGIMGLVTSWVKHSIKIAVVSFIAGIICFAVQYSIVYFIFKGAVAKALYLILPLFLLLSIVVFILAAATAIIKILNCNIFKIEQE
jgi:hypothetical protein